MTTRHPQHGGADLSRVQWLQWAAKSFQRRAHDFPIRFFARGAQARLCGDKATRAAVHVQEHVAAVVQLGPVKRAGCQRLPGLSSRRPLYNIEYGHPSSIVTNVLPVRSRLLRDPETQ